MGLTYSVITVCLNAGRTIADTVRSVLSQQPLPRQYLLVDGGSTDDTLAQVEAARTRLPPAPAVDLRLLQQSPLGPGVAGIPAAWNQALLLADADLIMILNADDWYEPNAAATVLRAAEQHPEADLFVSAIHYRSAPDAAVLRTQGPRRLGWLPVLMPVPHPGCFVRRRVYERLGPYDVRYAISADYDFIYRAARAGCVFRYLPEALVSMRPGGLARQRLPLARRETRDIARRHGAGLLLPNAAFLLRWWLQR